MRDAKPNDPRPARGGWSPGESYTCNCKTCGCWFTGAKRSFQCADCAYADEFEAVAPKPPMAATQARIEELARLAYEAAAPGNMWEWIANHDPDAKAMWLAATRTLYAAAMQDAAGVARAQAEHERIAQGNIYQPLGEQLIHRTVVKTADGIALTLEVIAKETDSDHG